MLQKKNVIHPFERGESETTLDFLSHYNDSAFAFIATHSKKRRDSLVLVRFFDHHILDMVELGISNFESIAQIGRLTCSVGTKPALIFNGELFEQREEYKRLQNILLDLFRGRLVDNLYLPGLESVISVTAVEERILFRVYRILLKKSGARSPRIELELMGPSMDWTLGRTCFASDDFMKQALRRPKELKIKREKNISTTSLGQTMGRVHVGKQNLDQIQTRKVKALKKKPRLEKGKESE